MNAVEHALLAVGSMVDGDAAAAEGHLASARGQARPAARRDRQILEVAALVVAGDRRRAAGLALEHTAEFPDDATLLAGVAGGDDPAPRRPGRSAGGATASPATA